MISLSELIRSVVLIIVAGLVFWLLWWLIDYCQIPEPFNRVARVVVAVAAVLVACAILLSLAGIQVIRL